MRTENFNGHEVVFFDSIDQLPMARHHASNKYLLLDAGIGSDLEDTDKRLSFINEFIKKGDHADAVNEINNLRQNLAFIMQNVNPRMLSFATFVHSIDGVKYDDMSPEGLNKVINLIGKTGVSYGNVKAVYDFLKKKLMRKWSPSYRISQTHLKERSFLHI